MTTMIAKVIMSNSISSLINYLKKKEHDVVAAKGVLPIVSNKQLVKNFERIQSLNTRANDKTIHIILSFPKSDRLDDTSLDAIIHDFIDDFSKNNEMWLAIRHPDTDGHKHVHVALNRVLSNGKLISDSNSAYRAKDICRKLEEKYQLQVVSNFKKENLNKRLEYLKKIVDAQIKKAPSLKVFKNQMNENGYKVMVARGITFIDKKNGMKVKGSDLGRAYSLRGIARQIEGMKHANDNSELTKNNTQKGEAKMNTSGVLEILGGNHQGNPSQSLPFNYDELKKKKKRKRIKR